MAAVPAPEAANDPAPTLADEALRRFIRFALDDRRATPPDGEALAELQPLIRAASGALSRLEVQAKYLPRRPSLLPRLLSAMNSDINSMRELAKIIGGDPTLLGNLLRVANSVFYRPSGKPVESLERAVTLVGTDGIRSVIATSLMHPVMAPGSGWVAKFPEIIWEHTQLAADIAEAHAMGVERSEGFGARMLALLHGLSTNTVFRIVRDEAPASSDPKSKPAVALMLDEWVDPIAMRIAESWALPEALRATLASRWDSTALGRSAYFGRLAAAQVMMVRHGWVKEAVARATVLSGDARRAPLERLWNRLVQAHLRPD